jgi:hypothetical protein
MPVVARAAALLGAAVARAWAARAGPGPAALERRARAAARAVLRVPPARVALVEAGEAAGLAAPAEPVERLGPAAEEPEE